MDTIVERFAEPNPADDTADEILLYLEHQLPGYPFRRELDRRFVDELLGDFPGLDLLEELKLLRWYRDDEPFTDRSKPRIAIRRWLLGAQRRGRC